MYEDGYFTRKVIGVGRLVAAWRWADKLQRATDEELRWAPNKMARSSALVRQQEADRFLYTNLNLAVIIHIYRMESVYTHIETEHIRMENRVHTLK